MNELVYASQWNASKNTRDSLLCARQPICYTNFILENENILHFIMNGAIKPISIFQAAIKYKQVNEFQIIRTSTYLPVTCSIYEITLFYYTRRYLYIIIAFIIIIIIICINIVCFLFAEVLFERRWLHLNVFQRRRSTPLARQSLTFFHPLVLVLFIVATLICFSVCFWSSNAIYTHFDGNLAHYECGRCIQ